jgi:hypothetical protein
MLKRMITKKRCEMLKRMITNTQGARSDVKCSKE